MRIVTFAAIPRLTLTLHNAPVGPIRIPEEGKLKRNILHKITADKDARILRMVVRHTGHSKLHFVHLSGITDGVNQALKNSENRYRTESTIRISYRLGISKGVQSPSLFIRLMLP